jgi:hypothetical protein
MRTILNYTLPQLPKVIPGLGQVVALPLLVPRWRAALRGVQSSIPKNGGCLWFEKQE